MKKKMETLLSGVAGVSILAFSYPALAQSSAPTKQNSAPVEAVNDGSYQNEVITVTAQRRSENLQDVPIAVTVLNEKTLLETGVKSALDLQIVAPALNTANVSGVFGSAIRGIGGFGFSPGIESEAALYIDNIYIATPLASELAIANVANVEVLKGPQGTLFGRNSTAGLIHIITATPTDASSGRLSLEYGSYNNLIGTGYVSGGLAEGLAADFSFRGERRDGFGKNETTGKDANAIKHDVVLRSKLVWNAGADTTVTAIGNYWDGSNTGRTAAIEGTVNGWTGLVTPDLGPDDYAANVEESLEGWTAGGSLKIEHRVGDVNMLSITGYRKLAFDLTRDLDFSPIPIATLDLHQTEKQISQEFQLSSAGNSRLNWTAGGYFFDLTSAYAPIDIDFTAVAINIRSKQRATSYSGYAQASYELFDDTNLTLGGRYTSETRKEVDSDQIFTVRTPVGDLAIPTVFPDRKVKANRFTYRVSLDHRFSEQVMGYASVNTGFKSGGFNTGSPGSASFKPEDLKAYELGLKTDLFDRRLRFNVAGFYYDYKNIQVLIIDPVNPTALATINGAKSRVYGIDTDFNIVLTDEFSLSGGFVWLDTKFKSFPFPTCPVSTPGGGVPVAAGDCKGNEMANAPKVSGSLVAKYSKDISGGNITASANLYYNGGQFSGPDNVIKSEKYATLGASVRWVSDSGFSVTLLGRNLTGRRAFLGAGSQPNGTLTGAYTPPRIISVALGYQF